MSTSDFGYDPINETPDEIRRDTSRMPARSPQQAGRAPKKPQAAPRSEPMPVIRNTRPDAIEGYLESIAAWARFFGITLIFAMIWLLAMIASGAEHMGDMTLVMIVLLLGVSALLALRDMVAKSRRR